ncbi:MAG: hypothetical protein JWQ03_2026, partial [Variovorax sp.]|nr:hypothetical protein [Variovorax sp.]
MVESETAPPHAAPRPRWRRVARVLLWTVAG